MYVMYPLHQQKVTQSAIVILSNNMGYIWPLFHILEKLLLFIQHFIFQLMHNVKKRRVIKTF